MKGDEDEDPEQSTAGTVRYPCMPSLVALQQMRNRLHMANLGKRLMKWTALATGRELRRLAAEINTEYEDFKHKVTDAFMLLARCRYYHPNFTEMVLENIHQKAARVTVTVTTKSIAGCRFMQYELKQGVEDPYIHLGIARGGEAVLEAKYYWFELLKKMLIILNLRTSFEDLDFAHKSATKKMNVLTRIVIPRTNHSITYILSELEELSREEFFRIKKVKNIKMRQAKCDHEEIELTCPVCLKILQSKKRAAYEGREKCLTCLQYLNAEDKKPPTEEELEAEKQKLEDLKTRLAEVVALQKSIEENKIITASMEEFLLNADDIREKLEARIKDEEERVIILPPDTPLDKLCLRCRKKVKEGDLLPEYIPEVEEEGDGEPIELPMDEITKITVSKQKTKQDATLDHIFVHPVENPDIELGVFETETKIITRIIRTRNDDGTITEERKVVRLRKEVKAPKKADKDSKDGKDAAGQLMYQNSETSQKSSRFPDSKTIGRLEINQEITNTQFLDGIEEITSIDNLSQRMSVTPKNSKIYIEILYNNKDSDLKNVLTTLHNPKFDTPICIDDFLKLFGPLYYFRQPSTSTGVGLDNTETSKERSTNGSTQYETYSTPKFIKIENTPEFIKTDGTPEFIKTDDIREFIKTYDTQEFIETDGTPEFITTDNTPAFIKTDDIREFIKTDDIREFNKTYDTPAFIKTYNTPDFIKTYSTPAFIKTDSTPEFIETDKYPQFIKIDNSPELNTDDTPELNTDDTPELIKTDSNPKFIKTDNISEFIKTEYTSEFIKTDSNPKFIKTDNTSEFIKTDNTSEFIKTDNSSEFSKTDNTPEFIKIDSTSDIIKIYSTSEIIKLDTTPASSNTDSAPDSSNSNK